MKHKRNKGNLKLGAMPKKQHHRAERISKASFSKIQLVGFVLVFAAIGSYILLHSFAATPPRSFYVDPVKGSADGDGSADHPWRTLAEVISSGKIQTQDKNGAVRNPNGPVKPGDTIWLRSGYHGSITLNGYHNSAPVTVAAAPGQTPKIKDLELNGDSNWIFKGLSVSSSYAPGEAVREGTLVRIARNGDFWGKTHHIVFENNEIFSEADITGWTAADWTSRVYTGIVDGGDYDVVRGNHLKNMAYGIALGGNYSLAEYNTVENFIGDGLRGTGNYETLQYNLVKNLYHVNDDHNDGFQSWSRGADGKVGTGVVYGNTLIGNKFFDWTDPNQPYKGGLQGIGCFDGMFDGWTVENNLIVTNHWHGISFYGLLNSKIINNTVIDQNDSTPGPPWILIHTHKNGTPGANDIIRNNLAEGGVNISAGQTNIVSDHNTKVARANLAKYFVEPLDSLNYDFHLRADSPAVDAGTSQDAPAFDIDNLARPQGAAFDQGAYEFTATPGTAASDINKDGRVNITDLSVLLTFYGRSGSNLSGDLNADGRVNITDLSILLNRYGR